LTGDFHESAIVGGKPESDGLGSFWERDEALIVG
jgi:hypothetical protein